MDGVNILCSDQDPLELRRKVGMIFQKPTPFPMSVFENVAYGLKLEILERKALLESATGASEFARLEEALTGRAE